MREDRAPRRPRRPRARARRAPGRARRARRRTTRAASAAAGSAARRTELRTPSSSRSPAAARSPPTTRRCGLSTLNTNAAALPTHAAGVGDHAPAAEVAVAREGEHLGDGQLAVAAAQHLEQRAGRGRGLQAAAVAAAADRALGVDEHVAELAGHPAPAAVQPAAEDQPGADARGHLEVDEVGRAAAGAVGRAPRARRGSRRCRRRRARRGGGASPPRRRRRPSRAGSPTSR